MRSMPFFSLELFKFFENYLMNNRAKFVAVNLGSGIRHEIFCVLVSYSSPKRVFLLILRKQPVFTDQFEIFNQKLYTPQCPKHSRF